MTSFSIVSTALNALRIADTHLIPSNNSNYFKNDVSLSTLAKCTFFAMSK